MVLFAVRGDDAGHAAALRPGVLDEPDDLGAEAGGDGAAVDQLAERRADRGEDGAAEVGAPVVPVLAVVLVVLAPHRVLGQHRHAEVVEEPVDGRGGVRDGQPDQLAVGGVLADPDDVGEVRLGRVLDALRALQAGAGRAELAGGQVQGPAFLGRGVDDQHARAVARGEDRGGHAAGAGSDDDDVPACPWGGVHQNS
nr:hypothetical protein GCM10020063_010890 [Dactylosporangium thailandense]